MSLMPNETSLGYSVVPGNYGNFVVVTIALGAALHLEPDRSISASPEMLRPGSKKMLLTLPASGWNSKGMEPVRNRLGEEASWVPGKELG